MASFTDNTLPVFSQYVPQLPVQEMAQIGIERQNQYNQGIEKIQNSISNIAGLDLYRDVDKNYLQSKLNELGNRLTTVAAGDFSNFQLVNSVSGMTNQLIKDKNVQNAVQSTAHIRKQQSEIEKATKEGKSSPSNQYVFSTALQDYISNPEVGSTFSTSYIPYFDKWKFAKETFDAIKPGKTSWDEAFEKDPKTGQTKIVNGQPVFSPYMIRHEMEGKDMTAVKAAVSQIFSDPRFKQQSGVDAQYQYKDYTPNDLISTLNVKKEQDFTNLENAQTSINLAKSLGKNVEELQSQLDQRLQQTKDQYSQYEELARTNPLAIKKMLYTESEKANYTAEFGTQYKKELIMDSPPYKMMFDIQKEKNNIRWKELEYQQRDKFKQQDLAMESLKLKQQREIAEGKKKPGEDGDRVFEINQDSKYAVLGQVQDKLNTVDETLLNAKDQLLANTVFNTDAFRERVKVRQDAGDPNPVKSTIDAFAKIFNKTPEEYRADKMAEINPKSYGANNAVFKEVMNNYNKAELDWKAQEGNRKAVKEYSSLFGDIQPIKDYVSPFTGEKTNISSSDVLRLQNYLKWKSNVVSSDETAKEGKAAKEALIASGKSFLINDLDQSYASVKTSAANDAFKAVGAGLADFADVAGGMILDVGRGVLGKPLDLKFIKKALATDLFNKVITGVNNSFSVSNQNKQKQIIENLRRNNSVLPNVGYHLLTGDAEHDRGIKLKLKDIASEYEGKNSASDFKDFLTGLGEDDNTVHAQVMGDGKLRAVVVDKTSNEIKGSMNLSMNAAKDLKIDVDGLFAPKEAMDLSDFMKSNKNQSIMSNKFTIEDKFLYTASKDSYLKKNYFPYVTDPSLDIQVNFKEIGGEYYPYIYMRGPNKDGKIVDVVEMGVDAVPSSAAGGSILALGQMMAGLKTKMTDGKIRERLFNEQ